MRPEVAGCYYDEEKKRYFPFLGRSKFSSFSSITKRSHDSKPVQESNYQKRTKLKALTLLSSRELNGKVIHVNKKKSNFEEEIYKTQGSTPPVWKYPSTENTGNAALKYMQIDIQTSRGLTRKNILVAGSTGGTLSVLGVARTFYGVRRLPHSFRPEVSRISSIQLIGRSGNFHPVNRALITTLRRTGRRSVFFLNLAEGRNTITTQSIQGSDDVPFECTIWTADCNISGSHAALGTDLGAALVDLETGAGSYFLRSESDVLALQFHQSGNIVQCGLRDGAIVSLDLRERPRLIRHQIRHHQSSSQAGQTTTNKQWFELQGHINPSQLIYMPSSLTCLKTLKPYDQYLMASSMDGTAI
ncbi:PREDICTED: uncharacterized protein LOC104773164 isoform X2 [Camelina sativa]|uniref:Uncharacterized protein LOC104773164 isoform X2 n=1 Tax=Camelina sativa TaxID=90675 RepID=A0ABM0Y5Y6_CAMSA|nr:PREDICTED: uncharacterized protein LOC104773164 isoform X2 [Camelina sativa]